MGLVSKFITRGRVQPRPVVVGGWLDPLRSALPHLSRQELLTLATLRAFVELDTLQARSSWALDNEQRLNIYELSARQVHSVVRMESVVEPGDMIVCGAPSPIRLNQDWVLCARTT